MAPVLVTLFYPVPPSTADKPFDLNYYLQSHMPMVASKWGPRGLKSWEVTKLDKDGGNEIQCLLYWESREQWVKAQEVKEEMGAIFGDIPNYSTVQPIIFAGEVVGSS